jgi:hypothetical protein
MPKRLQETPLFYTVASTLFFTLLQIITAWIIYYTMLGDYHNSIHIRSTTAENVQCIRIHLETWNATDSIFVAPSAGTYYPIDDRRNVVNDCKFTSHGCRQVSTGGIVYVPKHFYRSTDDDTWCIIVIY